MKPYISFIIVNWNSEDDLIKCTESIYKYSRKIKGEIIVVDNNSSDNSVLRIKRLFKKVIIIANSDNKGFAYAVNKGIDLSKGNLLFFLNPDVNFTESSLNFLDTDILKNKIVGAVGVKVINPNKWKFNWPYVRFPTLVQIILFHTILRHLSSHSNFLKSKFLMASKKRIELIPGGWLMVKKEVIKDIGKFDEQFQLWFEDTDFCKRMSDKKWKLIYFKESLLHHKGFGSTIKLPKDKYLTIFYISMYKYFKKNNGLLYASTSLFVIISDMLITSFIYRLLWLYKKNRKLLNLSKQRTSVARNLIGYFIGIKDEPSLS